MQRDDPFASLEELCHISSSQQEQLTRCRFAGEPEEDEYISGDDSGGIPVESTGIVMLSLPDSHEEQEIDANVSRDNDVFLTPPEDASLAVSQEQQRQKTVSGDVRDGQTVEGVADNGNFGAVDGNFMDDVRAVDLGRDADLGFASDVEVTERIETDSGSELSPGVNQPNLNQVIYSESINFRINVGEVNVSDGVGETPTKKLKIAGNNLGWHTPELNLDSRAAQNLVRVTKSMEKLKFPSKNSKKLDENVLLESSRNISGTRTLNFSHSAKKLSFEGASPRNCSSSLHNRQNENINSADKEFQGDGSAKRKLKFHDETLESRMEENGEVSAVNEEIVEGETEEIEEESEMEDNEVVSAVNVDIIEVEIKTKEIEDDGTGRLLNANGTSSGANSHERLENKVTKSIDDIDKFRYVRPTGENASRKQNEFGVKRALPVSLLGNNSNTEGETVPNGVLSTSKNKEMTVFDALREVAKKYTFDPSLAKMSTLEAAKKGGMSFP